GHHPSDPELLREAAGNVGNYELMLYHDEHEMRLRENVQQFRWLVRRVRQNVNWLGHFASTFVYQQKLNSLQTALDASVIMS
ncbi:MAG TPA: hypothetical protein VMF69_20750, partial [Gemmataceae bacterium]|nr:hypothetical protein [Gemmataceae bacterium]